MRIDSSGRLGLGTSSPDSPLHLSQAAANTFFKIEAYADTQGADAGINVAREQVTGSDSNLSFWTNTGSALTQKMTIDSSGNVGGNVGIGTDTPIYDVQIGKYGASGVGSADSTLALASATDGTGSIRFGDGTAGTDANAGKIVYDHSDNSMAFHTSAGCSISICKCL
jgi:hypothetical protein